MSNESVIDTEELKKPLGNTIKFLTDAGIIKSVQKSLDFAPKSMFNEERTHEDFVAFILNENIEKFVDSAETEEDFDKVFEFLGCICKDIAKEIGLEKHSEGSKFLTMLFEDFDKVMED